MRRTQTEIRNLNDFIKPPHLPELSDMEALGSIYESPITLVAGEMKTTMEANCLKVVQSYGFDVNAEELAKALAYDRDQYDKGYADARKKYERPHGKWNEIVEPFGWDDIKSAQCSACGESYPYPTDCGFDDIVEMFKFCPECGAQMEAGTRWKEDEEDENGSI